MRIFKFIVGFTAAMLFLSFNQTEVKAEEMGVCSYNGGSFKSYMTMLALSESSPQYQYLANETYDSQNLRITNDGYYAVAMGSYYGILGDKFIVTFDNGTQVPVVKVDEKSDAHTSEACYGMSMEHDGSIIEPIITTSDSEDATHPGLLGDLQYHGNAGVVYKQFAGTSGISSINKISGSTTRSEKPNNTIENTFADSEEPEQGGGSDPSLSLAKVEEIIEVPKEDSRAMVIFMPNVNNKKLVFLDTEFMEGQELVQAAFIILERIDDEDHYFLTTSLNIFVNTQVSPAFEAFTGIKGGFLGNEGLTRDAAQTVINDFIEDNKINEGDSLVIGHGLNQDLIVLDNFGCRIDAYDYYDTLAGAKEILKREKNLKLSDLLLDAGLVQNSAAHDAYQDTRNLVPVFAHLQWVKYKED